MTKRMLIDDTHPEETRVVVVNGNKVEDVEFESSSRKQIKGNIYLAKVMRVEPSLQAAFVDYGGNKHGFLAFGEIHPDYYNISPEEMEQIDKEVDEAIESKKQSLKDREEQRERQRIERAERQARYEAEKQKALEEAAKNAPALDASIETTEVQNTPEASNATENSDTRTQQATEENKETSEDKHPNKRRIMKKRFKKKRPETGEEKTEPLKVLSEATGLEEETIKENKPEPRSEDNRRKKSENYMNEDEYADDDDDDDDQECDFELQKKLLKVRKLFHRSNIQEVIKEGQILIIQVVKEERGNKGAALTTYLSLAGRYCVLMPNRIKSGGVSRKITNANDRKRLKSIVRELPLTSDMSMIVRTAGEDKTKADIVRDYNYLIRSWNQIRIGSLSNKAPALIHEEGNLIKRALRDMYTKEISEIIVDGDHAYQMARDFVKILSPHNLKKIKSSKKEDIPLFQRFQVEAQLDKLHEATVQLESGGYLVINPTEALVSIDVNSGRATKEKDLEETALKTNLEAADEIAKQLRMRNLAGLVVIDFIDMEEQQNNHAVEKRMKEAMKKDRARIQIAKMSCFGLLEISRQRMHSSFMESNYQVCPHCRGQGMVRTIESGTVLILRALEEEGIKNRSSKICISVPSDVAIYLLNQKRQTLCAMEQRYKMEIVVAADDSIKNIADFKLERIKSPKDSNDEKKVASTDGRNEDNAKQENTSETNRRPDNRPNRQDNRQNNNRRQENNRRPDNRSNEGRPNDNRFANKQNESKETSVETPSTPMEKNDIPLQQNAPEVEKPIEKNNIEVKPENQNIEQVENKETNGENNTLRQGRRRDRRRDRRGHDHRRDNRERYNNGENNNYQARENNEPRREKSETVILYNSHESTKSNTGGQDDNERQGKSNWWRKLIG